MAKRKAYLTAGLITSLMLFVFSVAQWWRRARLPYNESGRYFDSETGVVWHQQGVMGYAILSMVSLLILAIAVHRLWKGPGK